MNKDIKDLNIAYLFCLREAARKDPSEASIRFGVDVAFAKAIAESSAQSIREAACPSLLQFKIRSSKQLTEALVGGENKASIKSVAAMVSEVISE